MFKSPILAALFGLTAQVYGQVSTVCPTTDICYGINIPANTASSGSGDIFFQISAPSTLQWVALGQGRSMSGSQIFVLYTSANGRNVTLSPRLSSGHSEPEFSSSAQVTLLEGTGISNGKMIANVKCSNCNSWSGGSMDFTGSSGTWIHASRSGNALNSDDTSASISQHGNDYGAFNWNWASGKGGSSVNPFTSSSGTGGTGGTAGTSSCVPRPTAEGANGGATGTSTWPTTMPTDLSSAWPTQFPTEWRSRWPPAEPTGHHYYPKREYIKVLEARQNVNYCDDSNSGLSFISSGPIKKEMLMAHGILAALAFVIFFPFGAISIRLFSFPGLVWFHAALQCLAYVLYVAGFGVGVYLADKLGYMDNYHPVIGIVCFILLFFQPILGFLHHASFKKIGRRGMWSHAHLWLGRIVITLGIINGGLGLMLADNTSSGKIAYGVVAAVVWLVWVAAAAFGEVKRAGAPPKYDGHSPSQSQRNFSADGLRPNEHEYYPPPPVPKHN